MTKSNGSTTLTIGTERSRSAKIQNKFKCQMSNVKIKKFCHLRFVIWIFDKCLCFKSR